MESYNRSVEKKQVKTVMPEQIVSDVEEKSDKHDAKNVRIIIAAVLIISGMINLLVPGVIPYNIPSILRKGKLSVAGLLLCQKNKQFHIQ